MIARKRPQRPAQVQQPPAPPLTVPVEPSPCQAGHCPDRRRRHQVLPAAVVLEQQPVRPDVHQDARDRSRSPAGDGDRRAERARSRCDSRTAPISARARDADSLRSDAASSSSNCACRSANSCCHRMSHLRARSLDARL